MKKSRIITTVAGFLLFLSIVLTSVWLYSTKNSNQPAELSLDEVASKIDKHQAKEVSFKQSQIELTDRDGKRFVADADADANREVILGKIKEYNKINASAPIKYDEAPVSSGFGSFILINSLPMVLFFIMWGLTLAVIVYAVRTLSRNKS